MYRDKSITAPSSLVPEGSRRHDIVAAPPSAPSLPVELFRNIVEAAQSDRNTLTALLRVSRRLHYEAARSLYEVIRIRYTSRPTSNRHAKDSLLRTLSTSPFYVRFVARFELIVVLWSLSDEGHEAFWEMFCQVLPRMVNLQRLVMHACLWDPLSWEIETDHAMTHQDRMEWDGSFRHANLTALPIQLRAAVGNMLHYRANDSEEQLPALEPSIESPYEVTLPSVQRVSGSAWLLNVVLPVCEVEELCYLPSTNGVLKPPAQTALKHVKRLSLQDIITDPTYAFEFITDHGPHLQNLEGLSFYVKSVPLNPSDISCLRALPRLRELVIFVMEYPYGRRRTIRWAEIEQQVIELIQDHCPTLEVYVLPLPTPAYWRYFATLGDTWWLYWPKVLFYESF